MKRRTDSFRPLLGARCETCKNHFTGLTPSHFVKNNHVHKSKRAEYDYESTENYFTQCSKCHEEYEKLGTKKKGGNKTRQEYMLERGLRSYADRIEWLISA